MNETASRNLGLSFATNSSKTSTTSFRPSHTSRRSPQPRLIPSLHNHPHPVSHFCPSSSLTRRTHACRDEGRIAAAALQPILDHGLLLLRSRQGFGRWFPEPRYDLRRYDYGSPRNRFHPACAISRRAASLWPAFHLFLLMMELRRKHYGPGCQGNRTGLEHRKRFKERSSEGEIQNSIRNAHKAGRRTMWILVT